MRLLTIYNICGISNKENTEYYIESLKSIFNQKNIDHDVVISSCLSKNITISHIKNIFPDIKINHIKDKVPVNVSFNHTASLFDNNYDGFLYIDSGIILNDENIISTMANRMTSGPYAMVSCLTDTDVGMAIEKVQGYVSGNGLTTDSNGKCVMTGSSLNLHCQIFSKDIKTFYNNIIPDIFAGFCTESVFTFVCAAIKKRWAVCDNITANHRISMDGASSGFHPSAWRQTTGRDSYDHPFAIDGYMDRILNSYAMQLGLGFEECREILVHDPNQYDENMFCINNDLKYYIKNNLYLKSNEFNYNNIQYSIV